VAMERLIRETLEKTALNGLETLERKRTKTEYGKSWHLIYQLKEKQIRVHSCKNSRYKYPGK